MASPRRTIELRTRGLDGAALVKRIAKGNESAFATLYDLTCGLIYGLLLRILGNSGVAEQVMAAVYQEVWDEAAAYDAEREKPMIWLITMAHSRAIARLRTDKFSQAHQVAVESASGILRSKSKTDEIISGEQKFIQSAFAELSTAQQQIIELAYFSGLRQKEIATQLSLSLQSVRAGMHGAMSKLRDASGPRQLHLS